jgi:CheY-like chemotaxis protein
VETNLAKLLVREGLVSQEQISEAVESGQEKCCGLGESLAALGYVTEKQLVEFLSKEYGVPSMDIDGCEADRSVIGLIPGETAFEKFLVPIRVEGGDLTIAVSDPSNILMLDDLGFITGKNIKPVVASGRSIRNKLAEFYGERDASGQLSEEEESVESGPREISNTAFLFPDRENSPADDIIRELEHYRKNMTSVDDGQGAEETHSSPGSGTGFDFTEEPEPETIDENAEFNKAPKVDFVFDFTDGKSGVADLPSSPSREGIMFVEEESGVDTGANGAQAGSGGPESPAPPDNELTPSGDVEGSDMHTDPQLIESGGENAREPISFERLPGSVIDNSGEPEQHSGVDGDSPPDELLSGSAGIINGPESEGSDKMRQENRGSVLIVDVSPTVRKIMRIGLERAGYKVTAAGDGMQALARLNETIPDLIFVDIKLPHMDGLQLCKVIKSHGLTKEVPVVMLSGKSGVLDRMKIKMAGASDLITKPFGSDDLVGAVEKYAR